MEIGTPITFAFLTLVWIYFVKNYKFPSGILGNFLRRGALFFTFVLLYLTGGSLVTYDNNPITNIFLFLTSSVVYLFGMFLIVELIWVTFKSLYNHFTK